MRKIAFVLAVAASVTTVDAARAQVPWPWVIGGIVAGVVGSHYYERYYGCGGYGCGRFAYGPPPWYYDGPPAGYYDRRYAYEPPRRYYRSGW